MSSGIIAPSHLPLLLPQRRRDYYHTCYCLSGLACLPLGTIDYTLKDTHKAHNIASERAARAKEYFSQLPIPEL